MAGETSAIQTTPTSAPFWEAAARGVLALQRCGSCEQFQFYPRAVCSHCGGRSLAWEESAGRGTIYSWTEVHRAPRPEMKDAVPYVVGIVELDEGVRLLGRIAAPAAEVRIGGRVQVTFAAMDGQAVPQFVLLGS